MGGHHAKFGSAYFATLLCLCLASSSTAQNTVTSSTSDPKAVLLANQAQVALTAGTTVSDILLNANVQWIAGGTNASGTATLQAKGIAESRLDIDAGNIIRMEIRNDASDYGGQWSGADGVRHFMSIHNCLTPAAWFLPQALVSEMLATDAVLQYVEQENRNGMLVDHLRFYRLPTNNSHVVGAVQTLSNTEVFLDASTHLPLILLFNAHPDNDYGQNIPIEIHFSNYKATNNIEIPVHIQRFIQGNLNLDLTVVSTAINTGLTDGDFVLQ
jgi:hypothetical protein